MLLKVSVSALAVLLSALACGAAAILAVTGDAGMMLAGACFAAPAALIGAGLFAMIYAATRTCSPVLGAICGGVIGVLWLTVGLEIVEAAFTAPIGALAGVVGAIAGRAALRALRLPVLPLSLLFSPTSGSEAR